MKKKIVFLLLVLSVALPAHAVSTFTVSPAGNGVFLLQGIGVEGAGALDFTITYDTASLANPRVELGGLASGALMAVNPNTPGIVRLAVIRTAPLQGSGNIATITFDRKGGGAGMINSLSVRISNMNGMPLPAVGQISNLPVTPENTAEASQNAGSPPAAPSPSAPGAPPIVVIPGPAGAVSGGLVTGPETSAPTPPPEIAQGPQKEPAAPAQPNEKEPVAAAVTPQKKVPVQQSVLDRFREYKGERTAKAFLALFDQEGLIGFRQEPPVAISTGKTPVKAVFITTPGSKSPSDVAVKGARLVSLKSDPDYTNTWIAELMPEKDAMSATIAIPQAEITLVYPITVAPRANVDLDKSGTVDEADFALFLRERGSVKAPKFDLNRDGKRDYLDDYIFTANYIVMTANAKKAARGRKQPSFPSTKLSK